jgi:hypothetical protein
MVPFSIVPSDKKWANLLTAGCDTCKLHVVVVVPTLARSPASSSSGVGDVHIHFHRTLEPADAPTPPPPTPALDKEPFWKRLPGSECSTNNTVLGRGDNLFANYSDARPWSITAGSFPLTTGAAGAADCATVPTLLDAIRLGKRAWVTEAGSTGIGGSSSQGSSSPAARLLLESSKETPLHRGLRLQGAPSVFRPRGCAIPVYSAQAAAAVLGRFDAVRLFGDSLLRHLYQGMLAVLYGDVVSGAIPTAGRDIFTVKHCRCDGMFSEVLGCRVWEFNGGTHGDARAPSLHFNDPSEEHDAGAGACDGPRRLKLYGLQGGLHVHCDVTRTIDLIIMPRLMPILDALRPPKCGATPPEVHVVWLGFGSQSRALDAPFPHQSRENASAAAAEITHQLQAQWPALAAGTGAVLHVLDWANLTADAQTSDGQHFLTDVNVAKAFALLRLMDLVSGGPRPA